MRGAWHGARLERDALFTDASSHIWRIELQVDVFGLQVERFSHRFCRREPPEWKVRARGELDENPTPLLEDEVQHLSSVVCKRIKITVRHRFTKP